MTRLFCRRTSCLAIGAWVLGALSGRAQTWIQWNSADGGNDHYYALTPTPTNWKAARALAISWGGTLATITSSKEQDFINATLLTGQFEHLPVWIGLYKSSTKGGFTGNLGAVQVQVRLHAPDFRWVTGEALSYTNWKSGEPSDTPPGEDYVTINWEYSDVPPRGLKGDWNDTPLNGTTGYGGQTDGPYFGLVERETDPNRSATAGLGKYTVCIVPMAALGAVLIYVFARSRGYVSSRP